MAECKALMGSAVKGLSQLKNQGLSISVLNILFHALIVSRIVCALHFCLHLVGLGPNF